MGSKKAILYSAVLMAFLGAGVGMLSQIKPANAAILVYDAENILQAAKTAINTSSIATNEQQQLALQILNMASMSPEQLIAYLKNLSNIQTTVISENGSKIGALNAGSSAQSFWNENFQNVEQVLNGETSTMDSYTANQQALRALEKTNQDALHGAKTAQILGSSLNNTLTDAVTASANASGTKEAVQANTQAMSTAAAGTIYGNNLLAELIATQAVKYEKETQDEAEAIALYNRVADQAQENVKAMKASLSNQQTTSSY